MASNGLTDIEVIDPSLGGIAIYLANGDGTFHAVFSTPAISNEAPLSQSALVTSTWSGPGDGAWSDASNWSTGEVPGQSDYVNITQPVTVTFDESHDIVAGLVVSNGATLAISSNNELDVSGPVMNFGTLDVASGAKLQIEGSVNGTGGSSTIGVGATIEFAAADSGSVSFNGSTGSLILDHSSLFSGEIFNFTGDGTLSGSDHIDLRDINEGSVQDSYANGVLTVTDGTNTATLDFAGNYTLANFKFANDGGTIVYDPPVPAANPPAAGAATDHPTIMASGANPTQIGSGGNDTFVFKPNFGQASIANFAPTTDVIQFAGGVFANVASSAGSRP